MAFALDECPAPYWEPYEPAQGRFVRGVDPRAERDFIESGVDEGKPRSFGSVQDDMLAAHSHTQRYVDTKGHFNQDGWEYVPFVKGGVNANGSDTTKVGGRETRPINVALLYCVRK
ncbi:hypothetical protein KUW14_03290 [Pseudooceanicola nitratireducens]|uniref:hypothetical protein n=1 Tax=Pseudooceanicola nitratireducens TaxID=517719 RepID=UPI001C940794|nr:hypothetical protein [Pseudooceanicola nitratireducens]MBY6164863.1 hypothetical protein [Pseudooceanicola nitratireducens]